MPRFLGINLADISIFLTCATTLATFDIKPAVDESGKEIIPDVVYTSGTIRQALRYLHESSNAFANNPDAQLP